MEKYQTLKCVGFCAQLPRRRFSLTRDKTGVHVARRPTRTEGTLKFPNVDADDARMSVSVKVSAYAFLRQFLVNSAFAESTPPRTTRTRRRRFDDHGGHLRHAWSSRQSRRRWTESIDPVGRGHASARCARCPVLMLSRRFRVTVPRDGQHASNTKLEWGRGRRYLPRDEITCRRAGEVHRGR